MSQSLVIELVKAARDADELGRHDEAAALLDEAAPDFKFRDSPPPLTWDQISTVIQWAQSGMISIDEAARILDGRISVGRNELRVRYLARFVSSTPVTTGTFSVD